MLLFIDRKGCGRTCYITWNCTNYIHQSAPNRFIRACTYARRPPTNNRSLGTSWKTWIRSRWVRWIFLCPRISNLISLFLNDKVIKPVHKPHGPDVSVIMISGDRRKTKAKEICSTHPPGPTKSAGETLELDRIRRLSQSAGTSCYSSTARSIPMLEQVRHLEYLGECVQTLKEHTDAVNCLAVVPEGLLVSASEDTTIMLWRPATGKHVATLRGHKDGIYSLAVLERAKGPGSMLASSSVFQPPCLRILSA